MAKSHEIQERLLDHTGEGINGNNLGIAYIRAEVAFHEQF